MTKQAKPLDLSEYAEEKIPFDAVIRRLGNTKAPAPTKRKTAKAAPKRKPRG